MLLIDSWRFFLLLADRRLLRRLATSQLAPHCGMQITIIVTSTPGYVRIIYELSNHNKLMFEDHEFGTRATSE